MTSITFLKCCFMPPQPPRKRVIDRAMIGSPTNFQHTGHIGSTDISREGCFIEGAQNQMHSKGGYSTTSPILSHLKLIDLQPITIS